MHRVNLPADRARCPGVQCVRRIQCARFLALSEPPPDRAVVQDYSITNSVWVHCMAHISVAQADALAADAAKPKAPPAHEYVKGLT